MSLRSPTTSTGSYHTVQAAGRLFVYDNKHRGLVLQKRVASARRVRPAKLCGATDAALSAETYTTVSQHRMSISRISAGSTVVPGQAAGRTPAG